MSQRHHAKTVSNGRKLLPAHARPTKPPPLLKRGHSYNNANAQSLASSSGKGGSKKAGVEVERQEDEQDMTSFPQFCTTCERQIVTPGSSLLYCSEACRRKDTSQTISAEVPVSPLLAPSSPSSHIETRPPDIVPQRSPTMLRPVSLTFSDLTISENGSPTDFMYQNCFRDLGPGDAFAQVHSASWNADCTFRTPKFNRCNTTTDSSGMPSLTHTPSSSEGTAASVAPQRLTLSRHNKSYSVYSTKSIGLVTPLPAASTQQIVGSSDKGSVDTMTDPRVADASDISFEKQASPRNTSKAEGSLRQLFRHEAMKAPPTEAGRQYHPL